jgi:hypothetical protein
VGEVVIFLIGGSEKCFAGASQKSIAWHGLFLMNKFITFTDICVLHRPQHWGLEHINVAGDAM